MFHVTLTSDWLTDNDDAYGYAYTYAYADNDDDYSDYLFWTQMYRIHVFEMSLWLQL